MPARRKIVEMKPPDVRPLADDVLLLEAVRALVARPEFVRVVEELDEKHRTLTLHVHVHRTDKGRVIGKRGRTISALRNLFSAIGLMDGRRVLVKLVED